ncbi:inositol hexakisphosphate kinase 3-like [Oppia nitens]|uniref:inositol hexakisphosphate kinase 3-like n=1 Tax=Oppia nitens TaxID=1686743 RepID=UPI0023DB063F|nr:inositol hexakisphosphate kinase 3-like [Oppia nitens]
MVDTMADENVITLEPFIHQVGGRSSILVFGQTICKPINSRELTFYETLPPQLKPFVPEFRGISEVYLTESSDGYLTITAKQPNNCPEEDKSQQKNKFRIKLCKPSGDLLIESNGVTDHDLPHIECNHCFENVNHYIEKEVTNKCETKIHNPWILRTMSAFKETEKINRRKFLLLENLTYNYKFPCVMDIKMGVRQYDDFANESKILSHTIKVSKTTSGSLGLRITGVQVYNKSSDRFICHNKYYGRTLTTEGFLKTMKTFLQMDSQSKVILIGLMIEKLEKLLAVIENLNYFRFYTTSLLIIYEGSFDRNNCQNNTNLVDIRIIDFAHTVYQSNTNLDTNLDNNLDANHTDNNGPDQGFIFGLINLIQLLKDIQSEPNNDSHSVNSD